MKAKLIFACLMISFGFFKSSAQTTVPAGAVSGIWTLAGSPYQIAGDISISNDSTLTIMPGVTVIFQSNYQLDVLGRLLAIGTSADTITFTVVDTSIGWQSIRFPRTASTNDTSKIIFCKLEYGKASDTLALGYGGALCFDYFSKAIVSNCLISNCYANIYGGAIYCFNSSPIISFNTIVNNFSENDGAAIECDSISNATITNNIISYNAAHYGAGTVSCNSSSPLISNNIISFNVAGGGGGIACTAANAFISYNIITNNSTTTGNGGGIVIESSSAFISNNTITNNSAHDAGGGIFCVDSGVSVILNNTIANNQANKGGALYCLLSSPSLRNCILWGNTAPNGAQVCLFDSASQPNFYYCDVQGDSTAFAFTLTGRPFAGAYSNNIDTNPLFVLPSGGSGTGFNGATADWSLQSSSPCINAGDPLYGPYPATDLAGNARIRGCIVDMGAYEFQQGLYTTIPPPFITVVNDTLFCSTDTSYSTYQWYSGSTIIPGATDTFLVITQGGNYNVQVANTNGCSIAVGINLITGTNEFSSNNDISLYPNPATSQLTIHTLSFRNEAVTVLLMNVLGETLPVEKIKWNGDINVNIETLTEGIYFVQIVSASGRWVGKFVKE